MTNNRERLGAFATQLRELDAREKLLRGNRLGSPSLDPEILHLIADELDRYATGKKIKNKGASLDRALGIVGKRGRRHDLTSGKNYELAKRSMI